MEKLIWLFDIREPTNPVSIATFRRRTKRIMWRKGAHFGPHNLHENRPGSFVSSTLILPRIRMPACGLTTFPTRIVRWETGALVPAAPERMMDTRPGRPRGDPVL
ncbi:Uncharacterised protein [Klebsiella pneumoniae]|uniref:Uncharacterized protein n=1 Tax=Klebsiella pneumoniae TaxID=573 RepID=A0A3S4KMD6_KLEPN|nr:Uncharacterised protein [Klebsiella pneumoniae]